MINVNWTYCGDHFAMCPNIESFCRTPETKVMLYCQLYLILRNDSEAEPPQGPTQPGDSVLWGRKGWGCLSDSHKMQDLTAGLLLSSWGCSLFCCSVDSGLFLIHRPSTLHAVIYRRRPGKRLKNPPKTAAHVSGDWSPPHALPWFCPHRHYYYCSHVYYLLCALHWVKCFTCILLFNPLMIL